MPLLSLMNKSKPPRPKYTMSMPPLYWFLAFALMGILWLAATLQPFEWKTLEIEKNNSKTLLILDKSASVSRYTGQKDWIATVKRVAQEQIRHGLVYACSQTITEGLEDSKRVGDLVELGNTPEVEAWSASLEFDAQAPTLKELIPSCMASLDEEVNVLVLSDRDPESWEGVRLQSLQASKGFSFYDLSAGVKPKVNWYFESVEALAPIGTMHRWSVRLEAHSPKNNLTSIQTKKVLVEMIVSAGSVQTVIDKMIWDQSKEVTELVFSVESKKIPSHSKVGFRFQVEGDSIELDNTYWAGYSANTKSMRVITDADNETWIHAHTRHLRAYWQALGNVFSYRGSQASADISVILVEDRLSEKKCSSKMQGKIWLAPVDAEQSFDGVCQCFGSIVGQRLPCTDLGSAGEWRDIILSSGGSQIGGQVGSKSSSFLYRYNSKGQDILFILFPLKPNPALGLSSFPGFVRKITDWHLSSEYKKEQGGFDNVSKSESTSKNNYFSQSNQLVSSVNLSGQALGSAAKSKVSIKTRDESKWGIFLFFSFFVILILESLGLLVKPLRQWFYVFLFLVFSWNSNAVKASSVVVKLGGEKLPKNIVQIPKLISSRTSMHISAKTKSIASLPRDLFEPLLWSDVDRFSKTWKKSASNRTGNVSNALRQWIQKGGTAVLEYRGGNIEDFQSLVKKALPQGSWAPLGVDHEISKSYYLFSGLPTCNKNLLYEFRFHGRMAILLTPLDLLSSIEGEDFSRCGGQAESWKRLFVNIWMGLLAMDYKKDQVHLPEILKRLR